MYSHGRLPLHSSDLLYGYLLYCLYLVQISFETFRSGLSPLCPPISDIGHISQYVFPHRYPETLTIILRASSNASLRSCNPFTGVRASNSACVSKYCISPPYNGCHNRCGRYLAASMLMALLAVAHIRASVPGNTERNPSMPEKHRSDFIDFMDSATYSFGPRQNVVCPADSTHSRQ
jgi:hypothetical protein